MITSPIALESSVGTNLGKENDQENGQVTIILLFLYSILIGGRPLLILNNHCEVESVICVWPALKRLSRHNAMTKYLFSFF